MIASCHDFELPGQVIEDMVKFSRVPGFDGRNAAFLHADKFMQFDDDGNIETINMQPFDPDFLYTVGMDRYLLGGGNGIEPLIKYMDQQKPHIAQLLGLANSTLTFIYGNKTGAEANAGGDASAFSSVEALSVSSSLPGPAMIDAWGYCKKKLPTTSAIRQFSIDGEAPLPHAISRRSYNVGSITGAHGMVQEGG